MINRKIDNFYDVLQLLKAFGFITYFKDKTDTLTMIESEIRDLYHYGLISKTQFMKSILIINRKKDE